MSIHPTKEPQCSQRQDVKLLIQPREKSLGTFSVRRALPNREQRMVGPFIFFDEMGPATLAPGVSLDVRPHPHIGIATITYLFDGEIMHRDSLGYVQAIRPGAVNLMTAGSGIVHSERSPEETLSSERILHGIQSWMALPEDSEQTDPAFKHHPVDELPAIDVGNSHVRIILGEFLGQRSPVETKARIVYLDATIPAGETFRLEAIEQELAFYVASGIAVVGDTQVSAHSMAVLDQQAHSIRAEQDCRILILGGDPVGKRHIWWNFVSSSKERIEEARQRWKAQTFGTVPGEKDFIPLPEI